MSLHTLRCLIRFSRTKLIFIKELKEKFNKIRIKSETESERQLKEDNTNDDDNVEQIHLNLECSLSKVLFRSFFAFFK